MKNQLFKITPIGGVGQIGHNMTLISDEKESFLIDAGILFPYEDSFGIRYLIPDMQDLPKCNNIIITHGHEDHIGAIFHVLERFPKIKIWASPFAGALIKNKLDYLKVSYDLNIFKYSDEIKLGNFKINPIQVNHSIPETFGMHVEKENASVFLVSDFKVDKKTNYERFFDFKKLEKISKNKTFKLLLPDSTNITSSNLRTTSEDDLIMPLDDIYQNHKGRIFVTCFASNIHRIQTFISLSEKYKRKVVLYGQSMKNYVEIAKKLGLIEFKEKTIIKTEAVGEYKNNLTIIVSGCQADFKSAFRRVAWGEDGTFTLNEKDLLLMSSKAIPGNEKKIAIALNKISENKCPIITDRETLIHASGHAGKEDLLELYNEYKPHHIIPIHGESYFLKKHAEYINEVYPQAKSYVIHNFSEAIITNDYQLKFKAFEPVPPILIHGSQKEIERSVISERRKCAENGIVFVSIQTDSLLKNKVKYKISSYGLPNVFNELESQISAPLIDVLKDKKIKTLEKRETEVKIVIRRLINNALGYKPVVEVQFL